MRFDQRLYHHTHAEDGTQRTQWITKGNPQSVGRDMASTHPFPYVGTAKGRGNRAGRKPGQIRR